MKKRDKSNLRPEIIIYIVLFLIVLGFILFFAYRSYADYSVFKEHQEYLKKSNIEVQSWMTISTISKKFHISQNDLYKILEVNRTQINPHITLDQFCKDYKRNCPALVEELNGLKGS